MPNIIINNYCNQKCAYCFAEDYMLSEAKRDMNLLTFIKILKYLRRNNDNAVRILGGEPFLSKNIGAFLMLSIRGGFDTIVFSNINIPNERIRTVIGPLTIRNNLRINCNMSNPECYTTDQWKNIEANIEYFHMRGIPLILGYNIYDLEKEMDFLFALAQKFGIRSVNLKITNSSVGGRLIIDNTQRAL